MKTTRVLLADDHDVVRLGIRQIIEAQSDMEVVGEAANGREAIARARVLQPDVILLDLSMPELSGLEAVHLLKEASPTTKVVVFSMHDREAYIRQVLEAGALGYVLKASQGANLLEAIRAARRGEFYLCPKIRADVVDGYLKRGEKPPRVRGYDLLSEREQQVFRLLVQGSSTAAAADLLHLSAKTVEKHRANIMKKLDIHDIVGLVRYAVRIGVLDPEIS